MHNSTDLHGEKQRPIFYDIRTALFHMRQFKAITILFMRSPKWKLYHLQRFFTRVDTKNKQERKEVTVDISIKLQQQPQQKKYGNENTKEVPMLEVDSPLYKYWHSRACDTKWRCFNFSPNNGTKEKARSYHYLYQRIKWEALVSSLFLARNTVDSRVCFLRTTNKRRRRGTV